jgi:uncharacterized caspase-like protein
MYEQGLGVEEDRVRALDLYRRAWGLPEDSVIYRETARAEREALEAKLEQQLREKEAQVQALRNQIDSLQEKLETSSREAGAQDTGQQRAMAAEIRTLKDLVQSLSESRDEVRQDLAALPKFRKPEAADPRPEEAARDPAPPSATRVGEIDFGQYYALVIGNRDYSRIEDLDTPMNDAREIAGLLEQRYGFKVQLLIDGDRLSIMKTINDLHGKLDEDDNLLVYYAGHGSLVDVGKHDIGYWLPVDADPPPDDTYWVPNEFVTGHLGRLKAKRVLVIADSCYGGLLSSAPGYLMLDRNSAEANAEYLRYKLPRRSRLLLSSGGNQPVIDSVGDLHSVFAGELIRVLRENEKILTVPELFAAVEKSVRERAAASDFAQQPVLKSIKGAGHEVGDFFFVPRKMADSVALR